MDFSLRALVFLVMRPKRHATHAVYDLKVHLVWITKYRYRNYPGSSEQVPCTSLHLLSPRLSVSEIMKLLKGGHRANYNENSYI